MLLIKKLELDVNLKECDLWKGENKTPEFLKMNPRHTIPTLDDDEFYLWESRAILIYLVEKYASNDSLYPKDPQQRAKVNQQLFFDCDTLYTRFGKCVYPMMFGKATSIEQEDLDRLNEALDALNTFLKDQEFTAGPNLTIADFAIIASMATIKAIGLINFENYQHIEQWMTRCEGLMPDYKEMNQEGADKFGEFYKSKTGQS